jgi:hypothetical protein
MQIRRAIRGQKVAKFFGHSYEKWQREVAKTLGPQRMAETLKK